MAITVALLAGAVALTLAGCPSDGPEDIGTITPIETPEGPGPVESAEAPDSSIPAEEGQRAPDFTLKKAGGGEVSLSDYEGKILVIDFWSTTCGGCIADMPAYQELYNQWDHDEVEYLGMSLDTRIEIVEGFLERKGFELPMALLDDETRTAYLGDGIARIPQARVIDAHGVMAAVLGPGEAGAEKAAEVVDRLLAEAG